MLAPTSTITPWSSRLPKYLCTRGYRSGRPIARLRACKNERVNLAELLTIPASIVPDQELVRAEGRALTYATFQGRAASVASALLDLGIRRGETVAVLNVNRPTTLEVLFACAAIGAVFMPLNVRARSYELVHMLGSTAPRLVLVGAGYREPVLEALAETT